MNKCRQIFYKDKDGKDQVRSECNMVPLMAVPRLETIDLNLRGRNDYIRSCAQQSCFQTYGNTDCKLPSPEAPPKL
jgi:hypothetical protein